MHTSQVIWSQMRAAGTKVLLSGAAGDENFAGYGIYFSAHQRDNLLSGRVDRYLRNALLSSEDESKFASLSGPLRELVKEAIKRYAPPKVVDRFRDSGRPYHYIGRRTPRLLYPMSATQTLHDYMTDRLMPYWLRSGDKVTMGMPVEARCPLLDYRVVELGFRLPVTYLIRDGWRKWILRKAMQDVLPDEVIWRKKKMGFPFPYERFQEESNSIMELILNRARNPFLDLSQRVTLKSDWKAMSFILWYELYFNENVDLFTDIQSAARDATAGRDCRLAVSSERPLVPEGDKREGGNDGHTFMPEYLRSGSRAPKAHRGQCVAGLGPTR
jgi:asparagine synthase (glutamine-hydrolysing)